jgi:hypothetical protein
MILPMDEKEAGTIADQVTAELNRITREYAKRGLIIKGGWRLFELAAGAEQMIPSHRHEMRKTFYFGAQHLYASIMNFLDPGQEPTQRDLKRMELIERELALFMRAIKTNSQPLP